MSYVFKSGNISDLERLRELLFDKLQKETQEEIMNIERELINKGQQIGWENGEKFGLEQGKKERTKEVVLTMLSNDGTVEMVAKFMGITADQVRDYMHVN